MARQHTFSSFKSLADIIEKEKDFDKLRDTVKNYNLVDEFKKIFPELSKVAQAIKTEKKILFLKVENSVWKSELNFQKNILIEKINKHYNEQVIKSIKFL
ncbi:MAG: DUF721 domain-containing protein [Melioribacteraceae bacterium]|jgi:hypothetical protein|nr:DUF721 domain-containing protein [Melioribacteraceae bacterium]